MDEPLYVGLKKLIEEEESRRIMFVSFYNYQFDGKEKERVFYANLKRMFNK